MLGLSKDLDSGTEKDGLCDGTYVKWKRGTCQKLKKKLTELVAARAWLPRGGGGIRV